MPSSNETDLTIMNSSCTSSALYVLVRVRKQFIHENRLWKRGKVGLLPNAVARRLIGIGRAVRLPVEGQAQ
jgi:hypothetical protein